MGTAVHIDADRCIGCGECVADCFPGVLRLDAGIAVVGGPCIKCGHCVAVCPTEAASIPEYGADDIEDIDRMPAIEPEQLLRAVKSRRSIRSYREEQLDCAVIEDMVQAARYTPTARNRQRTKIIIVQNELAEFKERLWDELPQVIEQLKQERSPYVRVFEQTYRNHRENGSDQLFFNAPAFVLVVTKNPWDGGLAAANMELAAVSHGAGVLHSGYLKRIISGNEPLESWLGIEGREIACCMLAGYPAVRYRRTAPRKAASVIVR